MRPRLHKQEFMPSKALPLRVNSWRRDGAFEEHDHDLVEILVVASGNGRHVTMQGSAEVRVRLSPDARRRCVRELRALERACSSTELLNPAERLGRLLLILHELASGLEGASGGTGPRSEAAHPAVIRAVRLLEEDLAKGWTLREISSAVHLDASYFDRVFKRAAGLSPMAYLARCRAERAAAMLSSTQESIAALGARVGWPEANYFARRFRQHFGMSATEYRLRRGRKPI